MLSSVLAWSRARVRGRTVIALACAAAMTVLAGCAAGSTASVTATGTTLTIYLSEPTAGATSEPVQDVVDAERLAFQQKQSEVTAFKLRLRTLENTKLSNAARTAIQDTSAVAYLGEILPGTSADTIGITNAQDLLQVSPTDTALELTQTSPAVSGSPGRYYESLKTYGRTFARVVPNSGQEAKVLLTEMQSLGVRQLFVTSDGSPYGKALASAVKQDASPGVTIASAASGADGILYAGVSAGPALSGLAQSNPTAKLFIPSALSGESVAASLPASTHGLYASSPGFLPKDLTPEGRQFVASFKAAYNRVPGPEAIFGYEAMSAVLDVVKEAGSSAPNRSAVVHDFFAIKNRPSVLGTYSINANGDTSLAPFVFSRLEGGRLVPFKFVQTQG